MLGSNFSRLIIAHYFKYNNIFEKKGGFGLMDPYMMHLGLFFFFTCQKVQKDAIESEYAISSLNQIISLLRWLNNFIFTSQHFILHKILTMPFPLWYIWSQLPCTITLVIIIND